MESNTKVGASVNEFQFEINNKNDIDPDKDFDPLLDFIDQSRKKAPKEIIIKIKIPCLPHSITKRLIEIIDGLEGLYLMGMKLKLVWICTEKCSKQYAESILFGLRFPHEIVTA